MAGHVKIVKPKVRKRLRRKVIVTRFLALRQMLGLPKNYSVRAYGSRMRETGADFFLGYDDGPQRDADREAALAAMKAADPDRVLDEVDGDLGVSRLVGDDAQQMQQIAESLEGNLTGCFYSDTNGADDALYDRIEPAVRTRVGRLLNDKMPTGVAVVPSMAPLKRSTIKGDADAVDSRSPTPPNITKVTNKPAARNATSLTTDSNAIANIMPW